MSKPFQLEILYAQRSPGYMVRRLHNLLQERAEALFADAEITFTQWVALMGLRDGLVDTCAGIARHLNHDTGATTRLVDQLERRGLVTRSRSESDRRVVHLKLTPQGKALAKALAPRIVAFWNEMLADFPAADVSTLLDMLERLGDRVEAEPVVPRGAVAKAGAAE